MPRTPRRTEPVPDPPNSIVASAATLTGERSRIPRHRGAQKWQQEAWIFYDTCGELRFAINYIANSLSRVSLYVGDSENKDEKVEEGLPAQALDALTHGDPGQLLALIGANVSLVGEGYLIGEPDPDQPGKDLWNVFSTQEVTPPATKKGAWTIDQGAADGKRKISPDDAMIIRLWRRHPRLWAEADSAVRAVLPVLRELEGLTKHVGATIDSRLAGAGVLLLPSEMSFGTPGNNPAANPAIDPKADPFIAALTAAMMASIADRDTAEAVVPIVVKAPGETLAHVKHLTFSTPLDGVAKELREEAIRRFALGIDLPPEVVLGQAESNHWSAWQIDEASIKVHIEPLCELICDGITREYLWPALQGQGVTDYQRYHLMYDTAELRVRADKSTSALALYDRLELNGEGLRRETGFDETDKPNPAETKDMLLRKAATGSLGPDAVLQANAELGADLTTPPTPDEAANTRVQQQISQARRPPQIAPAPTEQRPIPEAASAMLAACEVTALRAIEKARARFGRKRGTIDAAAVDAALVDAWEGVPRVAALCGIDAGWLQTRLDTYVRSVLTEGVEHQPDVLVRVLADA